MLARTVHIEGHCDPAFARMRNAFEENFARRNEIGAAVCVYQTGKRSWIFGAGTRIWNGPYPGSATPSLS